MLPAIRSSAPLAGAGVWRLCVVAGLWVTAVTAPASPGQENPGTIPAVELAETVERLLTDLDSDSLATRRQAAEQLIELGPDVLRYLPPSQPSDSPERAEALTRIRGQLEKLAAAMLQNPSRVTLRGTLSLWEALESIREQTGNDFARLNIESESQDLEIVDQTYWEAIDQLLSQFPNFSLHPFRALPGQLQLAYQPEPVAASRLPSYAGVFRLEPLRLETLSDLANPAMDALSVTLRIRWEPRLSPLSLVHDLTRLEAETERDHVLRSTAGINRLETPVTTGMSWLDLRLTLDKPLRDDQQLARIAGRITATLPAVETAFSFQDLKSKEPIEQRTGETVVTFLGVQQVNELQAIQIRVRFDDSAGSLESHRQWLFESPALLVDSQGTEVNYFTFETTLQRADEVGISYLFGVEEDLANYRFVYRVPSAILTVGEDWEIKKLDLP